MKKRRRRHPPQQDPYAGVAKGDTAELARRLAPPEEQASQPPEQQPPLQGAAQEGAAQEGAARRNGGTIVVNAGALRMPSADDGERRRWRPFGIEPVVLVVVALMLLFAAFIAWRVSTMEEDGPQPVRIVEPDDRSR